MVVRRTGLHVAGGVDLQQRAGHGVGNRAAVGRKQVRRLVEDRGGLLAARLVGVGAGNQRLLLAVDVDEDGLHLPEVLERAL